MQTFKFWRQSKTFILQYYVFLSGAIWTHLRAKPELPHSLIITSQLTCSAKAETQITNFIAHQNLPSMIRCQSIMRSHNDLTILFTSSATRKCDEPWQNGQTASENDTSLSDIISLNPRSSFHEITRRRFFLESCRKCQHVINFKKWSTVH